MRSAFLVLVAALVLPSSAAAKGRILAQPAPAGCRERIEDPARTMLGARQYARFTAAIAALTATWKVVVNEVPIQQFDALAYDRWEGVEVDATLGRAGYGSAIVNLFYKPAPPRGSACSARPRTSTATPRSA